VGRPGWDKGRRRPNPVLPFAVLAGAVLLAVVVALAVLSAR